jgi:SAM-dependent methyltransferase
MSLVEPSTPVRPHRPESGTTAALAALLEWLKAREYVFVTPSVATHRRVLRRDGKAVAGGLRDVFGWSLPFEPGFLPPDLQALMTEADVLVRAGDLLRSTVRVASLGDDLFLHSAFPPNASDAVFFGPDTYRFAAFLREELRGTASPRRLADIGAGSGVGGLVAARLTGARQSVLADLNPAALALARANLRHAGVDAAFVLSDGLRSAPGDFDLIVANPPFIAGSGGQTYRDGGDLLGCRLSLDWTLEAARRLSPGGTFLLYTGSAIVEGADPFRREVERALTDPQLRLTYRELDPDIFGSQLSAEAYRQAERIAAVGLRVDRRPSSSRCV